MHKTQVPQILPISNWQYPADLPVCLAREDILKALQENQVTILCGATGSGKSTQLPKFCLEAGLGQAGLIAHTQPRRLAARALAERIAEELRQEVGQTVGWQVRFKAVTSEHTQLKLMTDGVLLNELRRDRLLKRYDCIIIDEAHERSLNIDFLLGYLKPLLQRRPDLKLIVTSATLDAQKFAEHFSGAPVIEVPGKSFPIELRYRPADELDINEAAARAVREIWQDSDGDILIFLPGEREIREMATVLSEHPRLQKAFAGDILPLYARLGSAKQQKIFHPTGKRRIVLATNVAETSLTVPGIRHVIDTGTARVSRYNPRSKVQNLLVENIAQANADQRKGRCGRTAPGICIRLYAEDDFTARPRFPDPEVQRTNLASVLLQMADLGLGEAEDFPFIDPPHRRYLNDARRLLSQLQALKDDGRLTRIGHKLARLPVDPRFGRILLAAKQLNCLDEVLPIIAVLSMQDPRERDFENRDKIKQAHAPFRDKSSDFITLLQIWLAAGTAKHEGSNSEYKTWCKKHYLHPRRMQEWRDLHRQIRSEMHALDGTEKAQTTHHPLTPDNIQSALVHRALLQGLLDHIATHEEAGEYRGPRDARWRIHPESELGRSQANWIVAAEIVSTRRTYARTVAQVQPQWIEKAAAHLLKRQALEPAWDSKRGEVMAREQVSLYGLILVADRKVSYSQYDATHAQQIFIEQALIEGRWGHAKAPGFLKHNQKLSKRLQEEENRQRTRGVLISEQEQLNWYAQRLPAEVNSRNSLLKQLSPELEQSLHMSEADLRAEQGDNLAEAYPPTLRCGDLNFKIQYIFEPGSAEDGINLDVPVASLNQLPQQRLDWLVPGWLADKIECLIKALPKQMRRRFVPANETVQFCLQELDFAQGDFYQQLARCLQRRAGQPGPSAQELRELELPERLQIRIRLRDAQGKIIACSRKLSELQQSHQQTVVAEFVELHDASWEQQGLSDWPDKTLPQSVQLANGLRGYICLLDQQTHVDVVLRDDALRAQALHAQGLLRLLYLKQASRIKQRLKSLPDRQAGVLRLATLPKGTREEITLLDCLQQGASLGGNDVLLGLAGRAILDTQFDPSIRSQSAFANALEQAPAMAERLQFLWKQSQLVIEAWKKWQNLQDSVAGTPAQADITEQLVYLFAGDWMTRTPQFGDLSRYLEAICIRAERVRHNPAQDAQRMQQITVQWQRCRQAMQSCVKAQRLAPPDLVTYRWMIEEYRVSLFAQNLKTRLKVSDKRLDTQWQQLKNQLNLK